MSAVAETEPGVVTPPPRPRLLFDATCRAMADEWTRWHVVMSGLSWDDYTQLLEVREAAGRRAVRITYHRGMAEVYTVSWCDEPATDGPPGAFDMTVGNRHERWRTTIARLMGALAMGFRVPVIGAGSVTLGRADLDHGLEADESYYIQNAHRVRDVRELNFAVDPPPDLAIEVEISQTVIDKLELYAALGVPEVWRWNGKRLWMLHRTPAGGYDERPASKAFPALTHDVLIGYLQRLGPVDETELSLELFAWADAARTNPTPPETA